MRSSILLSVVTALCATGVVANVNGVSTVIVTSPTATVVTNNPTGIVYAATLPVKEFFNPSDPRGNVKGGIAAQAGPNGVGVAFTINFSNLPTSGGPFLYHIHDKPTDSTGNCTTTAGHLNPFGRGEDPPCDPTAQETCQVGDLSGKHGKITSDPFSVTYVDEYASIIPGTESFFGNRSFVIHFANVTRLTCANFCLVSNTTKPNATVTATPTPLFTGSAAGITASLISVFGALTAALLL